MEPILLKNDHFSDKQYDSEEEREQALKEENLQLTEASNALDSLTGIPSADDILLFAIPVCAPYNTMQNYKWESCLLYCCKKCFKWQTSFF